MKRPSIRTVAWLLAALVALAACGQGGDKGANTNPTPVDREEAGRLYAQCIRENGVPDFPDPDSAGRFSEVDHDSDDPKLRAAQEECRELAPGGEHRNTGGPETVEQMRAFSQCMRDNGLPDFPDPDAEGRLRGVGHEKQDDPKYQAALETCREKLPGGGEH